MLTPEQREELYFRNTENEVNTALTFGVSIAPLSEDMEELRLQLRDTALVGYLGAHLFAYTAIQDWDAIGKDKA